MAKRYPMLLSPGWKPLLALFGGTPGRSFVELDEQTLRAKFGWLFHHSFPLADIAGASQRRWPLLYGLGWRTNLVGRIGLIGSYSNVVEIQFRTRHRVRLLGLPLSCRQLAVSLKDPQGFLEALAHRGVGG